MSWAVDGQDGNGLHLEKKKANFFQVYRFCLKKLGKTVIMVDSLSKNSLNVFLLMFYKHFMYDIGS